MPLGVNVADGTDAQGQPRWEAVANGDNGKPAGRELEIASVLSFISCGVSSTSGFARRSRKYVKQPSSELILDYKALVRTVF